MVGRVAVAVVTAVVTAFTLSGHAAAEPGDAPQPLPIFEPGPSDWAPNTSIWPYTTFVDKITPEMVGSMSDACQWFNAQYGVLSGQVYDFNQHLRGEHDVYAAPGVSEAAAVIVTNLEQSTAFLAPRMQAVIIRNNLDNYGPYAPVYGGEPMSKLTFQLSRIAQSMKNKEPSGVTHANIVSMTKWADALHAMHVCG